MHTGFGKKQLSQFKELTIAAFCLFTCTMYGKKILQMLSCYVATCTSIESIAHAQLNILMLFTYT